MKTTKTIILLVLAAITFQGCKEKDFTDEQYIAFAKQIESELLDLNPSTLNNAVDFQDFENRIFEGAMFSKEQKDEIGKEIRKSLRLGSIKVEDIQYGADFRFLKFYRDKEGNAKAIFRLYNTNGSTSIEEWSMKVKDKQVVITDIFSVLSGIYFSEDYRHQFNNKFNLISEDVENINKLILANFHINNEDYNAADSILFYVLPQMQDRLYARTIELCFGSRTFDYEQMTLCCEKFKKDFADQERISNFYLMQNAIGNGLIEEVTKSIDVLTKEFGNDPVYYLYLSWAFQSAEAFDFALESLDSAITYMPSVLDLYINKLDIYYQEKRYEEFVKVLQDIDQLFYPSEEDLEFFSFNYPDICTYKDFILWKEERKQIINKLKQ